MKQFNQVMTLDDGAHVAVFNAMKKGLELREGGHNQSFEKCLQRAKGVFEVFNTVDKSRIESTKPLSVVEATQIVVNENMNESRAYQKLGDTENTDLFRERAMGALNIFDACATLDEKQKHRVALLNEIFPVED